MKALVTGATGFVGGHLVDQLLARGDEVTALVRSPIKARHLADLGVRLIPGALEDPSALAEAVVGQDVIYHSAALTGAVDEAEFLRANRDGTEALARAAAARTTPARLVLVSSMAAGGPARRGLPKVTDDDDAPVTMYGRSKLAGEVVLRPFPLPWTILRPPTVYGPRDRDNLLTVYKAARLGVAPVFGDGSSEVSVIHVADLAAAIIAAGSSDGVIGRVWYVNHPEVLTMAGMVRGIGSSIGRDVRLLRLPEGITRPILGMTGWWAETFRQRTILRADKANEFYQEAWTADPTPFMAATGWHPAFDFTTGSRETAAWYREAGWL